MIGYNEINDCCNSCNKPLLNTYEVITPNANLAVVKGYLRIDGTADDALLTLLIKTATEAAEKFTSIEFLNKGFKTYRDGFPSCIVIEKSKLQSVESIKYFDLDGIEQTLDSSEYKVTNEDLYSRIYPVTEWPEATTDGYQNVIIEFTAGFGADNTSIPSDIQMAITLMVSNLYANRGDCCGCVNANGSINPSSANALLSQYQIVRIC